MFIAAGEFLPLPLAAFNLVLGIEFLVRRWKMKEDSADVARNHLARERPTFTGMQRTDSPGLAAVFDDGTAAEHLVRSDLDHIRERDFSIAERPLDSRKVNSGGPDNVHLIRREPSGFLFPSNLQSSDAPETILGLELIADREDLISIDLDLVGDGIWTIGKGESNGHGFW